MTPEYRLAQEVIFRAFHDLFSTTQSGEDGCDARPTVKDKMESIRFLVDGAGAFADSRFFWCSLIGREPDELRETALDFLNGDDKVLSIVQTGPGRRNASHLSRAIAESRRMWAEHCENLGAERARWVEAARRRRLAAEARKAKQAEREALLASVAEAKQARAARRVWGGKDDTRLSADEVADDIWQHLVLPD